jgi:hypothetical protein
MAAGLLAEARRWLAALVQAGFEGRWTVTG